MINNPHLISIIIIHWNTPELLKEQLTNLVTDSNLEIIVIDNASSQSLLWIHPDFPQVKVIKNKINRGFAFACNQGAIHAKGDWLLFLNPDVMIAPSQIAEMIQKAGDLRLDACSPEPASEAYRKTLPTWWSLLQEFTPLKHSPMYMSDTHYTLTGGCLLIKSQVLHALGGWDERFFLWFEDSDLTKRLTDTHHRIGWVDVAVKHHGGASFEKLEHQMKRDIFFHSMDVYAKKHFSLFGKVIASLIKRRYANRKVLPTLHDGSSITVPNMRPVILEKFFSDNTDFLATLDELIVVTSGIHEKDIWQWRKKYPQVRFILLRKNKGVASTINIGLRASTGAWIGTVNDDTILPKDWIARCLACDGPHVGVLNPVIYHPDGKVESAGVRILKKGKAEPITNPSTAYRLPSTVCFEADAINGAIVLYKNEALNDAGIFDERFGSYLEDIDLSLRLRRNGWKNIVCLHVAVTHIGHATASQTIWKKKPWLDFRNWLYVILKNWTLQDLLQNGKEIILERGRNLSGIVKSFKLSK